MLGSVLQLNETGLNNFLENIDDDEAAELDDDWRSWARPEQLPPTGDWRTWLFLGGRGAGKTRAGAEWVRAAVREGRATSIALVGATYMDVRDVMIEGPSGIATLGRYDRVFFEPSKRRVSWPGGAVAHVFTAEEPHGIRGYQFDAVWCDEFAKWNKAEETFDMLEMALRIGESPRAVVTTTPRAIPALKRLIARASTVMTRAKTIDNANHLAPAFLAQMERQYAGTRLGRQELDAEIIEDNDRALWKREWIERTRVVGMPDGVVRIVIGVDPPASAGDGAAECGIVVCGWDNDNKGWVIADRSVRGLTPAQWGARVADAYRIFNADRVVVEANQGGDMVESVLRQQMPNAAIKSVHASRGKRARAEPVAALYERGQVAHCGVFLELEDQLCTWDGHSNGKGGGSASPDRMDALVWALADLFPPNARGEPRVRTT